MRIDPPTRPPSFAGLGNQQVIPTSGDGLRATQGVGPERGTPGGAKPNIRPIELNRFAVEVVGACGGTCLWDRPCRVFPDGCPLPNDGPWVSLRRPVSGHHRREDSHGQAPRPHGPRTPHPRLCREHEEELHRGEPGSRRSAVRAPAQAAAAAQPEDRQRQSAEQHERYVVHLDHLGRPGAQAVFPSRNP